MVIRRQINPCNKSWLDLLKEQPQDDVQRVIEAAALAHATHGGRIEALGKGLLARLARRARWFTSLLSTFLGPDVLDCPETTLQKAACIDLKSALVAFGLMGSFRQ